MEDYTDDSNSFYIYDNEQLQEVLNDFLYDKFKIYVEKLQHYDDLFNHCYFELQEYINYNGATRERDCLIDCIVMYFIGKRWPTIHDTVDYNKEFFDALKALKYTYGYRKRKHI